jgi:hypothetical protein
MRAASAVDWRSRDRWAGLVFGVVVLRSGPLWLVAGTALPPFGLVMGHCSGDRTSVGLRTLRGRNLKGASRDGDTLGIPRGG